MMNRMEPILGVEMPVQDGYNGLVGIEFQRQTIWIIKKSELLARIRVDANRFAFDSLFFKLPYRLLNIVDAKS
jgi:hypothetical protein